MRTKIILMLILGMIGWESRVFGQDMPESVAVCPPGEPAEEMAIAEANSSRIMTVEEVAVAADSIISNYDADWTDLSMQGKLTFDGLPMSVSVKVYMKRGESIILSARAPIFGEVARVEANQDSITFINKHTRCYSVQPLGGFGVDRKAYLTDLQDILLGQVAFPGNGRLTQDNATLSQWIALPTGESLLYPSAALQTAGAEYGFVLDSAMWQLRSFVLMLQKTGVVLETKYQYGEKGWTLGLEISLPKKKMQGEVQLTYPDYDCSPLEFTKLGDKYKKVDFKQLMKF
ncbi:MAG: DUF4292 domain-containing protein [Muribaculaceae bacterium]|nr:DUF4292 domain-containing protein [Muribaculaceae bacterium]MDE6552229.1 DUF4292 domain-containing protein [Muribaculaceae bacterium]